MHSDGGKHCLWHHNPESCASGLWEHNVGISRQGSPTAADEIFVVLSGRGRVTLQSGRVLELSPGTVGRLMAGESTVWAIEETCVSICPTGICCTVPC